MERRRKLIVDVLFFEKAGAVVGSWGPTLLESAQEDKNCLQAVPLKPRKLRYGHISFIKTH